MSSLSATKDGAAPSVHALVEAMMAARRSQVSDGTAQLSRVLTEQQQQIIHASYIRLLGHNRAGAPLGKEKEDSDIGVVTALNNALVLNPSDLDPRLPGELLSETGEDRVTRKVGEYAKRGWEITALQDSFIRRLFKDGGYALILEAMDTEGITTPYGFQIGFPVTPSNRYRTWSKSTMPGGLTFNNNPKKIWQIGRTGIVSSIDDVRDEWEARRIPISPLLEGALLQGNSGGKATKLVAGTAAQDLEKERVQCNIGELARAGNSQDILAKNEISFGSNGSIFDVTKFHRQWTKSDVIHADDHSPLAEIHWRILMNSPAELVRRVLEKLRKEWNAAELMETGHKLGETLKNNFWRHRFNRKRRPD